jgi:hypothetical protein
LPSQNTEVPEIHPCIYGQMTLGEGAKITHGDKVGSTIVHIKKEEIGPLPYM